MTVFCYLKYRWAIWSISEDLLFKMFCSYFLCFSICLILISEFLFISMKIRPLFSKSSFSFSPHLYYGHKPLLVSSATLGPANCDKMNRELFGRKQQPQMIRGAAVPLISLLLPTNPAQRIINLTALNCFKRKKCLQKSSLNPWRRCRRKVSFGERKLNFKTFFWKRGFPVVWGWLDNYPNKNSCFCVGDRTVFACA